MGSTGAACMQVNAVSPRRSSATSRRWPCVYQRSITACAREPSIEIRMPPSLAPMPRLFLDGRLIGRWGWFQSSVGRARNVAGSYSLRAPGGVTGFGCVLESTVAGAELLALFCLGFFGSRPLRFSPFAIATLLGCPTGAQISPVQLFSQMPTARTHRKRMAVIRVRGYAGLLEAPVIIL